MISHSLGGWLLDISLNWNLVLQKLCFPSRPTSNSESFFFDVMRNYCLGYIYYSPVDLFNYLEIVCVFLRKFRHPPPYVMDVPLLELSHPLFLCCILRCWDTCAFSCTVPRLSSHTGSGEEWVSSGATASRTSQPTGLTEAPGRRDPTVERLWRDTGTTPSRTERGNQSYLNMLKCFRFIIKYLNRSNSWMGGKR